MDVKEILSHCDHTLLKQESTWGQIKAVCDDGMKYDCASVCIPAAYVKQAADYVGNALKICTVIGFPNGYSTTESKVLETIDAFAKGATEADVVINIGWLRSGRYADLEEEIRRFVAAAGGKTTKVILETYYLTDEEKRQGVRIAKRAGADFIKTSTGFAPTGATLEDIKLMVQEAGDSMQVKASGGIRSREFAEQLLDLGATRLGASNPHKLML